MQAINMKARAKINLSLDVLGKRPDGYHDLRMIMQTIELHDDVLLEPIEHGIEIGCNSKWVPSNADNIAFKAADLLIKTYGLNKGVRITINKKIPVAAGLAGGSSNAAAVLKGMNGLFSLNIKEEELMALGKSIGADVPYCIKGGTMLAEGIGEKLTPLRQIQGTSVVLVKPQIGVSTAWVYKNLVLDKIDMRPDTQKLIEAIQNNDIQFLASNMANVLESVTIERYKVITEAKERLLKLGALGSMMSGSGPTVFALFEDKNSAEKAFQNISDTKWDCYITETINGGE